LADPRQTNRVGVVTVLDGLADHCRAVFGTFADDVPEAGVPAGVGSANVGRALGADATVVAELVRGAAQTGHGFRAPSDARHDGVALAESRLGIADDVPALAVHARLLRVRAVLGRRSEAVLIAGDDHIAVTAGAIGHTVLGDADASFVVTHLANAADLCCFGNRSGLVAMVGDPIFAEALSSDASRRQASPAAAEHVTVGAILDPIEVDPKGVATEDVALVLAAAACRWRANPGDAFGTAVPHHT
jgi:hypothetical protein